MEHTFSVEASTSTVTLALAAQTEVATAAIPAIHHDMRGERYAGDRFANRDENIIREAARR